MPSKERVYYVYDRETGENLLRRNNLHEAIAVKRNRNKKAKYEKYAVKGSWIIHKV